jgi:hypothetical protein
MRPAMTVFAAVVSTSASSQTQPPPPAPGSPHWLGAVDQPVTYLEVRWLAPK